MENFKNIKEISNNEDGTISFLELLKSSYDLPHTTIENTFKTYFKKHRLFNEFSLTISDTCLILSSLGSNCKIYFFLSNTFKVEIKPIILPFVEEVGEPLTPHQQNAFDSYNKFIKSNKIKDFDNYLKLQFFYEPFRLKRYIKYFLDKKNIKNNYTYKMSCYHKKLERHNKQLKDKEYALQEYNMYVYSLEKELNHLKSLDLDISISLTP